VIDLAKVLARRGAMKLVPDVVEAVAGEKVKGTWWAHPKGKEIFRLASALEDSPDVVVAKLAGGKVTFVHVSLWPSLVRVVTDAKWRAGRAKTLSAEARRLLATIEKKGSAKAKGPLKNELEKSALVRAYSEHTESGHHATTLQSWRAWASKDVARAAKGLALAEALETLRRVGIDLG
jgi:hypothetical protein